MPEHSINARARKKFKHIVAIEGVLHDKTIEFMKNVESLEEKRNILVIVGGDVYLEDGTKPLNKKLDMIVMLGGDVQQEDGTWKCYTVEMLEDFLKHLPKDKKILFLNGPRTGRFIKNRKGELIEDLGVHHTEMDPVTHRIREYENKNWTLIDFKYGQSSQWVPALKTAMIRNVPIIMESSSTSMLSEMRTLGLKAVIASNPIMTETSKNYVHDLYKKNKAYKYPEGLKEKIFKQVPLPPQENIILTAIR